EIRRRRPGRHDTPGRLKRASADEPRVGPPEQRAGRSAHVPDSSAADEASGRPLKEEAPAKRPRFSRGSAAGTVRASKGAASGGWAGAFGRSGIHGMTREFQADDGEAASAVAEAAARRRRTSTGPSLRGRPARVNRGREVRSGEQARCAGASGPERETVRSTQALRSQACARILVRSHLLYRRAQPEECLTALPGLPTSPRG